MSVRYIDSLDGTTKRPKYRTHMRHSFEEIQFCEESGTQKICILVSSPESTSVQAYDVIRLNTWTISVFIIRSMSLWTYHGIGICRNCCIFYISSFDLCSFCLSYTIYSVLYNSFSQFFLQFYCHRQFLCPPACSLKMKKPVMLFLYLNFLFAF